MHPSLPYTILCSVERAWFRPGNFTHIFSGLVCYGTAILIPPLYCECTFTDRCLWTTFTQFEEGKGPVNLAGMSTIFPMSVWPRRETESDNYREGASPLTRPGCDVQWPISESGQKLIGKVSSPSHSFSINRSTRRTATEWVSLKRVFQHVAQVVNSKPWRRLQCAEEAGGQSISCSSTVRRCCTSMRQGGRQTWLKRWTGKNSPPSSNPGERQYDCLLQNGTITNQISQTYVTDVCGPVCCIGRRVGVVLVAGLHCSIPPRLFQEEPGSLLQLLLTRQHPLGGKQQTWRHSTTVTTTI